MLVRSTHKNAVGNLNLDTRRQFMTGEMTSIMTRNLGVASCLWVVLCTRVQLELGVRKEERSASSNPSAPSLQQLVGVLMFPALRVTA